MDKEIPFWLETVDDVWPSAGTFNKDSDILGERERERFQFVARYFLMSNFKIIFMRDYNQQNKILTKI